MCSAEKKIKCRDCIRYTRYGPLSLWFSNVGLSVVGQIVSRTDSRIGLKNLKLCGSKEDLE